MKNIYQELEMDMIDKEDDIYRMTKSIYGDRKCTIVSQYFIPVDNAIDIVMFLES